MKSVFRVLLTAAVLATVPTVAWASCSGQFSAGEICGVSGSSQAIPSPASATSLLDRNFGAPSAQGTVLNRGAFAWAATATPVLGLPGTTLGALGFAGSSSGTATVQPQAAAGTPTLTLPNSSGTFAVSASSPLALSSTTGALTCATCVTGTGGALAIGTTPVSGATAGQALSSDGSLLQAYNVSQTATASSLARRDANANLFINNYLANAASTVSAGGTTILTASSARYQALTGSSSQTFQLPDATTLSIGPWFVFNNNSSGSLIITNAGGSTLYTVPAGGLVQGGPTNIGSANGTWDFHPFAPGTVTWSSGVTGLVMNSALSTTASVYAGASSSTQPAFIPQRGTATTGLGGDSTHLYGIVSGSPAWTATSSGTTVPNLTATGSFTATGLVTNADLANSSITIAGNATSLGGSITASTILDSLGSTQGDVLYRSATGWTALTPGTAGYVLTTGGPSADPSWTAAGSGSGTVTSITQGTGMSFSVTPITTTGTINIDKATSANFEAATSNKVLTADNVFTAETTTSFSTTPTFDFSTFFNTAITLTNNISSITCSNQKAGQSGVIRFIQDATGGRTLPATFGCNFKFANGVQPVLSTAASAVDAITYSCISSSYCVANLIKNIQ